jgi:hypothetical protein
MGQVVTIGLARMRSDSRMLLPFATALTRSKVDAGRAKRFFASHGSMVAPELVGALLTQIRRLRNQHNGGGWPVAVTGPVQVRLIRSAGWRRSSHRPECANRTRCGGVVQLL